MSVKDFNKFREYKRKRSLSGSMSGSKSSSKSPSKSRKSASKSRSRRSRVKSVRTKQNLLNNKAFYAIVIILGLLLLAGIFWLVRWACSKDASSETEENIILGKSKDRCYDSGQVHRPRPRQTTPPHDRYAATSYGRSRQSENLWTRACNWAHRYRSELIFGVFMWCMYKMCVDPDSISAGGTRDPTLHPSPAPTTQRTPTLSPSGAPMAPTDPRCKVLYRFVENGNRMERVQCGKTNHTRRASDLKDACEIKKLYCDNKCSDPAKKCMYSSVTGGEMKLLQKFGKDYSGICQAAVAD